MYIYALHTLWLITRSLSVGETLSGEFDTMLDASEIKEYK